MCIRCTSAFTSLVVALIECLEYGLIDSSDDAILSLFECVCNGSDVFQEIGKEVKTYNAVCFFHRRDFVEFLQCCDGVVVRSLQPQASLSLSSGGYFPTLHHNKVDTPNQPIHCQFVQLFHLLPTRWSCHACMYSLSPPSTSHSQNTVLDCFHDYSFSLPIAITSSSLDMPATSTASPSIWQ